MLTRIATFLLLLIGYCCISFVTSQATCTTDADCTAANSFCDSPSGCTCKQGYALMGTECAYQSGLGEVCTTDGRSACVVPNSECLLDASNTNTMRCKCSSKYVQANHEGMLICGLITDVAACDTCIKNGGTCYSNDATTTMAGCKCPVSKSGPDCNTTIVSVECKSNPLSLSVCIGEFDGYPYTTDPDTTATIRAHGMANSPSCRAQQNVAACGPGKVGLVMSLNPPACGISLDITGINTKRYVVTLVAKKNISSVSPEDEIRFLVYCGFTTHSNIQTGPVEYQPSNKNNQGQFIKDSLDFYMENPLGDKVTAEKVLRLGDKIRMVLQLTKEPAHYAAAIPLNCLASTEAIYADPKAISKQLFTNTCPNKDQPIFTNDNSWEVTKNDSKYFKISTGDFKAFRILDSKAVYIHCRVRVCLQGDEENCETPSCDGTQDPDGDGSNGDGAGGDGSNGDGADGDGSVEPAATDSDAVVTTVPPADTAPQTRRKRSAPSDDDTATVTQRLFITEDDTRAVNDDKVVLDVYSFAVILALLLLAILVLVAIAALLYYRLRRGQPDKTMAVPLTSKPQRFAIPRTEISHVRM